MSLTFEWNEEKARTNLKKHGVSFDEAKSLFNDPFLMTFPDPAHSVAETRYVSIRLSAQGHVLVVSHTDRAMNIRLIGCRKATRTERRAYEENR
jgi:uncharacterized DUF497 family protein